MKHYSLYDTKTGLLVDRTFATNVVDPAFHEHNVAQNTPAGHGMVEGLHDHLSKRVDLDKLAAAQKAHVDAHAAQVAATRKDWVPMYEGQEFCTPAVPLFVATAEHLVDHQPPQPSADHEWNDTTKRWQLTAAVQAKASAAAQAGASIAALRAQQHDLVPRAVIGDADAVARIKELEAEIAALQGASTKSG